MLNLKLGCSVCVIYTQVNTYGVISFRTSFPDNSPRSLPLNSGDILIAPFWNRHPGRTLYRFSNDSALFNRVRLQVEEAVNEYFTPTSLFIATWERVAQFNGNSTTVRVT